MRAREMLLKNTTGQFLEIEAELDRLTNQLRESREENDFFETDLRQWKEELARMGRRTRQTIKYYYQTRLHTTGNQNSHRCSI